MKSIQVWEFSMKDMNLAFLPQHFLQENEQIALVWACFTNIKAVKNHLFSIEQANIESSFQNKPKLYVGNQKNVTMCNYTIQLVCKT